MASSRNTHPIAFFAYKRDEHARKALIALQNNVGFDPSLLHIFCDGARRAADVAQVEQTRSVIRETVSSESAIVYRNENWGLAKSIIAGVSELTKKFGTVIVLEDDLITSPHFLSYMNQALDLYANEKTVMQVSGFMFPVSAISSDDAFFLPLTTSWGWATWHRAWEHFDPSMHKLSLLDNSKSLRYEFDLRGSCPYYKMICSQREKKIDSWAIRWYMSVFLNSGLTLYPRTSLIANIGFDGSGTHCASEQSNELLSDCEITGFPSVELNRAVTRQVVDHLRHQNRWWNKLWRRCLAKLA